MATIVQCLDGVLVCPSILGVRLDKIAGLAVIIILTGSQYLLASRSASKVFGPRLLFILLGISTAERHASCTIWGPQSHVRDFWGCPSVWRHGGWNAMAAIWGVEILCDAGAWYHY